MIFPVINSATKPDRLTCKKNEQYDLDMARWCVKSCSNSALLYNIYKYIINWNFYKGNQWIFREDLEQFLMDDTGDHRNRIRWAYNLVKPLVNHYVGTAIKTDYTSRAYNISPLAVERQEMELAKRLKAHDISTAMPLLKGAMTQQFKLGKNVEETENIFYNEVDMDDMVMSVNELLRDCEDWNRFDTLKPLFIKNLAIAGICIAKNGPYNGRQRWKNIDPAYYIYDTSGQMGDHSDAEYQGDIEMFLPTQLFEHSDLSLTQRKEIETASRNNVLYYNASFGSSAKFGILSGRLPKYNMYWHDTELRQYGYVRNPLGTKSLMMLGSDYTREDMVSQEELTEGELEKVGRSLILRRQKDIIRCCEFVPKEFVGGGEDIVIERGPVEYQETYTDSPYDSSTPYKVATYDYRYGEVITACDDVISPQRMMNRYLSMMESVLNGAGGANYFYDKSLIPNDGGSDDAEADFKRSIRKGEPTAVDATRWNGNVQNAVIPYDATNMKNAPIFQAVLQGMKTMVENSTGVNQYMSGTADGTKVLKSVQQNSIGMGQLIQEPFYDNFANFYKSIYKCVANRGRMIYADNDIVLVSTLKDRGARLIRFSKDMPIDEMGIRLRRVPLEQTSIDSNNDYLLKMVELGLLGKKQVAQLWNRAEMDEVSVAIREYIREQADMADSIKQASDQERARQEEREDHIMEREDSRDIFTQQMENVRTDKKTAAQIEKGLNNDRTKILIASKKDRAESQ